MAVVENERPVRDPDRAWYLRETPVLTIGAEDPRATNDTLYEFHHINGAFLLRDGRIVIAVMGSSSLRFYDADGTYLRTVGRKGQGPGEFRQILDIYRTRGDTLAVNDFLVELEWFTPSGERIDRRARRDDAVQLETVAAFSDGTHFGVEFAGHEVAGRHRQRMLTVLRADARGRSTDSLITLPGVLESTRTPGYGARPVAFTPTLHFAVLDDSLVTAHSTGYEIQVRDRDGRVVRTVRRAWQAEPVDDGLRERFLEGYLYGPGEGGRPKSEEWRRQQQPWLAKDPYADSLPAFQRLVVSREGDFWVERYRVSWQLQPYPSITPRVFDEESTWDVFDRAGRWQTVVTLPPRFTLLDAMGDRLLGLIENDDGEQGVRVLSLVRPP